MAFVCEWPALGIPVTRAEVDTRIILETAARALTLWDLPEEEGPSGWTGYGPATW
jgi:hypothetical protein